MIKAPIKDAVLSEHIASLGGDAREIFLLADGKVRAYVSSCTEMINQVRANFDLGLLETYVLGQGYIAGSLLSATVKENDRIQLNIECGGPIKGMTIESWACGAVRGYLLNNPIPLTKPLESLDTSMLYGPGFLSITKILEGAKAPFTGQIMLENGQLAKDLALYYQQSEQTPTLFYLSLDFDREGRVWGAGGVFLQALPGCDEETLISLQEKSQHMGNLAKAIGQGEDIRAWMENAFADYGIEYLSKAPLGFSCPCSEKHFDSYLTTLPEKEKDAIMNGEFPLVLECFNCGTKYSYTKEEAEKLLGGRK